jgi:transcription factor CON7
LKLDWRLCAEFKEIRKEWKARKKEEESVRKAEDERARQAQAAQQAQQVDNQGPDPQHVPQSGYQQNGGRPSLPPIGYQGADSQHQGQYAPQQPNSMAYPQQNGQMQPPYGGYPQSPYGQQGQGAMYGQREWSPWWYGNKF